MPIDKTELAAEIDKNPEIVTVATEALTKKGFVVRDKASDTTFLDNFKRDVIEKEIPKEIAKVHSQYDADIKTTFGIDRNQDEKSYDYMKRAAGAKLTGLQSEVDKLQKVINEKGDPTGVLQKKIEEIENRAKTTIEGYETKIKGLQGDNEKATKNILLTQDYNELSKTFVKQLPAMFDKLSKMTLDSVLSQSVLKDGKLYLSDGTGGIKKDATFKEITVADYLKTEFKDVIDVKREQGGAGSKGNYKPDADIDPTTINKDNFQMPASVKNQGDLMDAMIEMGIKRGSKEFTDIWNKFALGYEIVMNGTNKEQKKVGTPLPSR